MKILNRKNRWLVWVGLMIALPCLGSELRLPEPVLTMDFDKLSSVTDSGGVGDTRCYDLSEKGKDPLVLNDSKLLSNLAGLKSLTVTCWLKQPASFDDVNHEPACLLVCPGVFEVRFDRWGRVALLMTGADGRKKQVWSSWVSYGDLSRDNRWTFLAFSYDGTKKDLNAAFYYGYESYGITRDTFKSADAGQKEAQPDDVWSGEGKKGSAAGQLSLQKPSVLVIGADKPDGKYRVQGALDSVKIFASSEDDSAALKQSEIEMIREADIGENALQKLELQAAENKQKKKLENMRLEDTYWSEEFNLHQVDPLTRIFSNKCPPPVSSDFVPSVPKGAPLPILFAAMYRGTDALSAQIEVSDIRSESGVQLQLPFRTYEVIQVPVEANNNGGIRTAIDTRPPEIWNESLIAKAPFKIAEVLRETQTLKLRENKMHDVLYNGILVDFKIPQDATPGLYHGSLKLKTEAGNVETPFSFRIADVTLGAFPRLDNIYWFKAMPENLTTRSELPVPWSEEHWTLIRNSAKTLREFGQTGITINLIGQSAEKINFIQTYKTDDGYRFDYKMFDRWYKTFLELGFRQIEGDHLFGGHQGYIPTVYVINEKTGEKTKLFSSQSSMDDWFAFLRIFAADLYRHLQENGWTDSYYQSLMDEPTNLELYKRAKSFTDKYLPGIPTKDACGNSAYSDYIDVQVFNMYLAKQSYQNLAVKRRADGKSVWLYHCASPYPPYPNRHLDEALSDSQLYPWIAYLLHADGYLFWAANNYRFADPYKSSIGPLPNGGTYPGHPPGDDWMYYPGPDGLRGSMRMLAFREGLLDHALLMQLAEKDPVAADEILQSIIRNPLDYSMESSDFHVARQRLLDALEKIEK